MNDSLCCKGYYGTSYDCEWQCTFFLLLGGVESEEGVGVGGIRGGLSIGGPSRRHSSSLKKA